MFAVAPPPLAPAPEAPATELDDVDCREVMAIGPGREPVTCRGAVVPRDLLRRYEHGLDLADYLADRLALERELRLEDRAWCEELHGRTWTAATVAEREAAVGRWAAPAALVVGVVLGVLAEEGVRAAVDSAAR